MTPSPSLAVPGGPLPLRGPFSPLRRAKVAQPVLPLGLVSFASIVGLNLLGADASLVIGLFLLWAMFIGVTAIARISRRLADPKLNRLSWFYIAKLCVVVFLVVVAWMPFLQRSGEHYGYDPQRYYFEAEDASRSAFGERLAGAGLALKNPGIVYYYGAMFLVLPPHPLVPAIANTLVTLAATLLLLRLGYAFDTSNRNTRWTLGLYMVCPDVSWFDCITSRETVVGACCIAAVASLYMLFGREGRSLQRKWRYLALLVVCTSALVLLRTSALLPVALAMTMRAVVFPFKRSQLALGLTVTATTCCLLYFAPVLNQGLGAVGYDQADSIFTYGESNVRWQEQSFGRLLTPQSAWGRLGVAPLRILAYMIQPFRSFSELAPPYTWLTYEYTAQAVASVIYLILFPLVLASLPFGDPVRCRKYAWLVFPFWSFMLTLAVGTAEVHIRYRIMAIPFLCGCAWLGRGAGKKALARASLVWAATLVCASMVYGVYRTLA